MLNTLLFISFGILVGLLITVFILWQRQKSNQTQGAFPLMMDLQNQIASMRSDLQNQVIELSRQMSAQWQDSAKYLQKNQEGFNNTIGNVQDRLGQLQQATHNMIEIGKDISSLQDILRAPKLRGGLGELLLSELLRAILPEDHFSMQYSFQSGAIVDAVIVLGQGIIPIDAKFPLENFNRLLKAQDDEDARIARKQFGLDVKKHIDHISSKYILPMEGTFEFAMMYIPAENVYYESILKGDEQSESLSEYALKKRVVPVSPNSFYAYLQVIVRGLKGMRIERSAQIILESLGQLETDFQKCAVEFEKTGVHLSNAASSHDKGMRRFEKLHDRLASIEDVRKSQAPSIPSGDS